MEEAKQPSRPLLAAAPPLPFFVAFLLGIVAHRWGPAPLPRAPRSVARSLGLVLILVGAALDARSLAAQFTGGASPIPSTPSALVTGGPYRRSRNPIYIAHALVTTGSSLAVTRSTSAPLFALAALGIVDRWIVPFEERELEATFGEEYRDYCQRVPRWL